MNVIRLPGSLVLLSLIIPLSWTAPFQSSSGHSMASSALRAVSPAGVRLLSGPPLPGTRPLNLEGDIASELVAGVDRYLLKALAASPGERQAHWHRDFSSTGAYQESLEPNRQRLAHILGVRDPRLAPAGFQLISSYDQNPAVSAGSRYAVFAVRWPVLDGVHGEGLILVPSERASSPQMNPGRAGRDGVASVPRSLNYSVDIIALPDADQTPEQIAGLAEGVLPESQFARRLAESGCRVLVPLLITRDTGQRKVPLLDRGKGLTNREFLYRSAFELGRHLIGYELQKVLAAVDIFASESVASDSKDPANNLQSPSRRIGVIGWGEGGMLALYAAALDRRIDAACVSGFFNDLTDTWEEPIDRNVFGLLEQFGGAELASMVAPRGLIIEAARGPEMTLPGQGGGAPAQLRTPALERVRAEFERAQKMIGRLEPAPILELVVSGSDGTGPFGTEKTLSRYLESLSPGAKLAELGEKPEQPRARLDLQERLRRQISELNHLNQRLLADSPYVRSEFMKKLDTSSLEKYEASVEGYRRFFYDEVIGRIDEPRLPLAPRSRQAYEARKWNGYEVVLDVYPDVIAYGILLLPNDLKPGEKRPVVVCQHGLEGRPQDLITGDHAAYHDYAARLAERGFITFAPQNLYIFRDRFRTLQRKANLVKKTLFSIITPQHQQIVDWLKTLPYVDEKRIAFYGLSYGGKTAMRVPPLVTDYCLSICSADFNEWVWKNASTLSPYSYVWTGEYEIFEFDLGSTFNYAEMAALIAPRPFMVERGHFDGVAPDETVGYEFAKVRHLYQAKLGLTNRCEIEWFVGPHTIHGVGTFDFLHRHLNWPGPDGNPLTNSKKD